MLLLWWVYYTLEKNQAYRWMPSYLLQRMLSFDNLFKFHMIFNVYGTSYLKRRPLYFKIIGVVMLRLILVFAG